MTEITKTKFTVLLKLPKVHVLWKCWLQPTAKLFASMRAL